MTVEKIDNDVIFRLMCRTGLFPWQEKVSVGSIANIRYNKVICCARTISDEERANRRRFPTVVYNGELVYILPNFKKTFKLDGDVPSVWNGKNDLNLADFSWRQISKIWTWLFFYDRDQLSNCVVGGKLGKHFGSFIVKNRLKKRVG